jgi:hypothetical protein
MNDYPPIILTDSSILFAYYSVQDNYHIIPEDFTRIRELNQEYADLPGDFADLSLITISELLNISSIITLDSDFDIYRRYRKQPFERVYLDLQR